jgi:DNA-binding NarL/FixJ family response regulator
VRVARTLAYMYLSIFGDAAVMSGWIARAQTLLAEELDSSEAGWVALNRGMFESEPVEKERRFREALESARRFGDSDLEFVTLAYLGASLVHADRTEEGMVLLDEALAAVAGSDVDDFCVLQEIFCQLFSACERAHDVSRADQWIRIGEAIAERRNLPAVAAFCRTHYGGVLTAAGRWSEADAALTEALRLWGLGHRSLRGGALARLADLRVHQGRFEEADQLLEGLEGHMDAARPIAAIQLAKGNTSLAKDTLERALDQIEPLSSAVAPLLALLVDVHLAANAPGDAEAAVQRLDACATRHKSHYLAASAALARGQLCVATGTGDPQACLREALAGFDRAQMPVEVAHSRLALASALLAERPEVALAEARAALEAFERLHAARHADAASAVLRSLGVRTSTGGKGGGLLSKRETEVLELLGHGLSNPEISDRLYISRKTVEHHVGNVLAKLGLRSRSEAAAYSARAKAGEQ